MSPVRMPFTVLPPEVGIGATTAAFSLVSTWG